MTSNVYNGSVDGSEIWQAPVELGTLSTTIFTKGFKHIHISMVVFVFLNHQQYHVIWVVVSNIF